MIQQNLTYYISSSTAILQNNITEKIFYNVSCSISGEAIETGVSHSGEASHDHDVTTRIKLYSGSYLVASFPYHETNYYINSYSLDYLPNTNNKIIQYIAHNNNINFNPTYYLKIIDSSSLSEKLDINVPYGVTMGNTLVSSSKYNIEMYSGDNKFNQIYIYDSSSILITSSSWIGTASYTSQIEVTGSDYYLISASIVDSICYTPKLLSIDDSLQPTSLEFLYSTGSCKNTLYVSLETSVNQVSWSFTTQVSCSGSLTGSYPFETNYYRIKTYCSSSVGEYYSDYSNTLGYIINLENYNYLS